MCVLLIMLHVCTTSLFERDKARVLDKADLSRKGSVDALIRSLVDCINACEDFYTTSSCSGRAVVFCEDGDHRKKGCHWLLVSHDPISCGELMGACDKATVLKKDLTQRLVDVGNELQYPVDEDSKLQHPVNDQGSDLGYAFFKFEPFVLHMMCRSMERAQTALQAAIRCGFRNSGITCGKKGKIMLAVRSTHSLEVPLCHNGILLVSKEYLSHLVELCNKKFTENSQRIERFFHQLKASLEQRQPPSCSSLSKGTTSNKVLKEATKVDKEEDSCVRNFKQTTISSTCTNCAESDCGCNDSSAGEFSFENLFDSGSNF